MTIEYIYSDEHMEIINTLQKILEYAIKNKDVKQIELYTLELTRIQFLATPKILLTCPAILIINKLKGGK